MIERFFNKCVAIADSMNTHKVFGVGLLTSFASLALIGIQPWAVSNIIPHLGSAGPLVNAYLTAGVNAAFAILPPAVVAAAFGRPPNVPPGPIEHKPE